MRLVIDNHAPNNKHAARNAMLFSIILHIVLLLSFTHYSVRASLSAPSSAAYQVTLLTAPITAFTHAVTPLTAHEKPESTVPHKAAPLNIPIMYPIAELVIQPIAKVEGTASLAPANATNALLENANVPADLGVATTPLNTNMPAANNATPREALQVARPDYAHNPPPEYPMLLREQNVGGMVWIRVWVDSDGQPAEIKLAKGSGYRLFDDAALRAVRNWRFIPARSGEQKFASWVEFPIRFTLNG